MNQSNTKNRVSTSIPVRRRSFKAMATMTALGALGLMGTAGCEGDTGRGALIGGGLGVAAGTLIGDYNGYSTEGALLGGLIGASTGAAIGAQSDLRRERARNGDYYEGGYGDGYHSGYGDGYNDGPQYPPQGRRYDHYQPQYDPYCDY